MKMTKFFAAALLAGSFSLNLIAGGPGGNPAPADDFCTTLTSILKLAPANFASIKGDIDEAMTEEEEEDVFQSTQALPGFERALIMPTFSETKKKIYFTQSYDSMDEAQTALTQVETSLKGCLTTATGYKARVDSGIHFFESTTTSVQLMTKEDYDDEGETIYLLLLQANKK